MERKDMMAALAAANDEEVKDILLRLSVREWLEQGYSTDDICFLVHDIANGEKA